jgi:hypothetical protein
MSDYFHLKVNLKEKIIYFLILQPNSVQTKTPVVPVAKFTASVVDIGGKFAANGADTDSKFGVIDTSGKFATSVVDTSGAP